MLRQRHTSASERDDEDMQPFIMNLPNRGAFMSCSELLQAGPLKTGFMEKKSNSWQSTLLPCCYPKWRRRYMVLIGNYLFRFESQSSSRTKGVPIPIDSVTVKLQENGYLELSTLRKFYYLRAESEQEAESWAQAIKSRKLASIKESMGHATVSSDVKKINTFGNILVESKIRSDQAEFRANAMNPMTAGL